MLLHNVESLEQYFSRILSVIRKTKRMSKKKHNRYEVSYKPGLAYCAKSRKSPLLFSVDDSVVQVLTGYTIDQRIFLNLLRKIIVIKLNNESIWTRQFYSQDIKQIFVVIKPLESALKSRAVKEGFQKQLELGFIDLLSLEPVDRRGRPY